ncbi:U-box domain [Musa troglodytarum]|uniref:RING-type E3 ubiquitin transferase n=1 Tax=Musa troglodytarum TaxID=320322 RepID=A0A9E7GTA8_9LILI|nr:U-box domain [Musa troglodytarum]
MSSTLSCSFHASLSKSSLCFFFFFFSPSTRDTESQEKKGIEGYREWLAWTRNRADMKSGKQRWKLSFRRSAATSPSTSASTSPAPSFTAELPVEFLCPISRSIMADPVIIPSGHTFERSCIQACLDLAFLPPNLPLDLHLPFSSPAAAPPLLLISNAALKSAIVAWCARCGLPPPLPIPPEAAVAIVRRLMPQDQPLPPSAAASVATGSAAVLAGGGKDGKDEVCNGGEEKGMDLRASEFVDGGKDAKDGILPSVLESKQTMNPATPPPLSERERGKNKSSSFSSASTPSSSSYHSSSSYSSSEIVVVDERLGREQAPRVTNSPSRRTADAMEEVLTKLTDLDVGDQESAAAALRQATRESRDRRVALCTPQLLGALRPMLLSSCAAVQINTAAALANLSLELVNKVRILRSGIVPAIVEVLRRGHSEARDHAAGALFGLALQDENRTTIGVLGAIPPLLNLFARPSADGPRARRDAGMALYHLSFAAANRSKIARAPGAVHALLAVAREREEEAATQGQGTKPARIALMVIHNLAGCNEGRAVLMDAGAVAALVTLMRGPPLEAAEEEHCVAALYWMSQGSLRFRGLAKAAGAEQELTRVATEGGGRGPRGEMARRALRAIQGEEGDNETAASLWFDPADDVSSAVSDGLKSLRPRRNDFDHRPGGINSAKF